MASIGTKLYTWVYGELMGEDALGNKYYRRKFKKPRHNMLTEQRWVIYNGLDEASKVTAEWFRWLHHTTNTLPSKKAKQHSWQKPHLPNLSGTPYTYRPPGSLMKQGKRLPALADYTAWNPNLISSPPTKTEQLEHSDES